MIPRDAAFTGSYLHVDTAGMGGVVAILTDSVIYSIVTVVVDFELYIQENLRVMAAVESGECC